VASGTGTVAATIPVDAGHTIVGGRAHERRANGHFDRMRASGEGNKSDLGHPKNLKKRSNSKYRICQGYCAILTNALVKNETDTAIWREGKRERPDISLTLLYRSCADYTWTPTVVRKLCARLLILLFGVAHNCLFLLY
jgi:hypothetical protein